VAETVHHKLSVARPSLSEALALRALAQQLADGLGAGKSRDQAYGAIKHQLDGLGRLYARVGSVITATADVDTLDGYALLGDSAGSDVGVGVAQGPHPELGDSAIWVVILLATRR